MWNFLIQAAIMFAIAYFLQPKPKFQKPKPMGLDDFDLPTAEEGRPLAVIFGKCRYKGPNVVWYGDLRVQAVTKKVRTGLFSSKKITTGYRYYLGVHMILGYSGVDGIKQIIVGEKAVWPTPNDLTAEQADGATSATIQADGIFGGNDKEGGVSGTLDIEYGDALQGQNSYLVSKLGSTVPAYRGQTGIVLKNMYVGTNVYIKPWSYLWKRTDTLVSGAPQWYIAKANIGDDSLNVVHVIREVLTDKEFGLGFDEVLINDTNFQAAADTCYTEGLGVSFNWDHSTACEETIQNLLDIIDGALYQDQISGKFELVLARDDYTPGDLDVYDESDIAEITEFHRPGYGEVTSRVIVNWKDVEHDKIRPAVAEDPAVMIKQSSQIVETTFDYQAVVDETVASNLASRELKQMSSMLAVMKIKCLKTMASVQPYSVFKLSWAKLGLDEVIVRVVSIDYGETDDNYIIMDVVEDVFGTPYNIYSDPPASLWTSPISNPIDTTYRKIVEAPYWVLSQEFSGSSLLADLDADAAFMLAEAVAPSTDSFGCGLLVEDYTGSGYVDEGTGVFCPSATLDAALPRSGEPASNLSFSSASGLESVEAGDYAIIDNEIVVVESIDVDNFLVSIGRAVFDTLPAAHSVDARIWFVGSGPNFIEREYTNGDTPRVKFLPQTGNGVLAEGSATYIEASSFGSRMSRPYAPGRLLIDGNSFPTHFVDELNLSWRHRDRTAATQLSTIVRYDNTSNYGPEAGTTYELKIYDEDNSLVRTEPGLTGTTYDYTEANERSDCSLGPTDPLNSKLRFVLKATRGSYDSFQVYDITVQRSSQGTITATSTTTGDLSVDTGLAGPVSASVVTEGDLSVRGELLKGDTTGTVTTTGRIIGGLALMGTPSGTATSTGDLTVT